MPSIDHAIVQEELDFVCSEMVRQQERLERVTTMLRRRTDAKAAGASNADALAEEWKISERTFRGDYQAVHDWLNSYYTGRNSLLRISVPRSTGRPRNGADAERYRFDVMLNASPHLPVHKLWASLTSNRGSLSPVSIILPGKEANRYGLPVQKLTNALARYQCDVQVFSKADRHTEITNQVLLGDFDSNDRMGALPRRAFTLVDRYTEMAKGTGILVTRMAGAIPGRSITVVMAEGPNQTDLAFDMMTAPESAAGLLAAIGIADGELMPEYFTLLLKGGDTAWARPGLVAFDLGAASAPKPPAMAASESTQVLTRNQA